MFAINTAILVAGILLLLGIISSKFSSRLGMPVLVMFLGLGMLAGSEGIGGIAFEDYSLAYAVGSLALALILFAGGLSTPLKAIQATWRPAGMLATWGVFVTAILTGIAASYILNFSLLQGLLLGSIVGSTDAAAVFAILRAGGIHLRPRLAYTLEVESGSNDPMAIFLTVGLIEVLTGKMALGPSLIWLFVLQMGLGLVVGIAVGYLSVWLIRKIQLTTAGLYPVLATAFGLLSFGLSADLGGSGFLSVYITGIVIGNNRVVFQRGILMFHDAAAWLAQIVMFVMLGLLSFPSKLLDVFLPGLAIAAVLIFIARPVAVGLSLASSRFTTREKTFLSWVGLKGAVPITLATFPLLAGIEGAEAIFNIVFFVVLISAILQGWSLPWVARKLDLEAPTRPTAPVTLEISSLYEIESDIVNYFIDQDNRVVGKRIRELALPDEVVVAMIVRQHQIKLPKGSVQIESGDHVIGVMRPDVRPMVDRVFSRKGSASKQESWPTTVEFPLRARVTVGDLEQIYEINLGGSAQLNLDEWMRQRLSPEPPRVGDIVQADRVKLRVAELNQNGSIKYVGLNFLPAIPSTESNTAEQNVEQSGQQPKPARPADEQNTPLA